MSGNRPPRRGVAWVTILIIVAAFLVFLTTFIWIIVGPRGKRLGEIAIAPGASIDVEAAPGDRLHFRLDLVLDATPYAGSNRQREESMRKALRASTVTAQVTAPNGAKQSASCPAYNGINASASLSGGTFELGGVPITCEVPIQAAGRHRVEPSVVWEPDLKARSATFEVRSSH